MKVAPLVGAWIEIRVMGEIIGVGDVAPLVGAWIEILDNALKDVDKKSLPLWERGLKYT